MTDWAVQLLLSHRAHAADEVLGPVGLIYIYMVNYAVDRPWKLAMSLPLIGFGPFRAPDRGDRHAKRQPRVILNTVAPSAREAIPGPRRFFRCANPYGDVSWPKL